MTLVIHVPEEQSQAVHDEMVGRGFAVEVQTDDNHTIPQWQIDETRRRLALKDQPEARLWSEIKKKYAGRGI